MISYDKSAAPERPGSSPSRLGWFGQIIIATLLSAAIGLLVWWNRTGTGSFSLSSQLLPAHTLNGSVFIATGSGENIRLGAVDLAFFDEGAINAWRLEKDRTITETAQRRTAEIQATVEKAAIYKIFERYQEEVRGTLDLSNLKQSDFDLLGRFLANQQNGLVKLARKGAITLSDVALLHAEIKGEFSHRVAVADGEVRYARSRGVELPHETQAVLTAVEPQLRQVLERNFADLQTQLPALNKPTSFTRGSLKQEIDSLHRIYEAQVRHFEQISYEIAPPIFSTLPKPIAVAQTGPDGVYRVKLSGTGRIAIAAQAARKTSWGDESYWWFLWIDSSSTEFNLNNTNLVGAQGGEQVFITPKLPALKNEK